MCDRTRATRSGGSGTSRVASAGRCLSPLCSRASPSAVYRAPGDVIAPRRRADPQPVAGKSRSAGVSAATSDGSQTSQPNDGEEGGKASTAGRERGNDLDDAVDIAHRGNGRDIDLEGLLRHVPFHAVHRIGIDDPSPHGSSEHGLQRVATPPNHRRRHRFAVELRGRCCQRRLEQPGAKILERHRPSIEPRQLRRRRCRLLVGSIARGPQPLAERLRWFRCAGPNQVRGQRNERLDGGAPGLPDPPRPLRTQPLAAPRPPRRIGADPLDRQTVRRIEARPFIDRHQQLRAKPIALGLRLERSTEVTTVDAPLQPPATLVLRRARRRRLQREHLDALPHRADRRRSNRPSVELHEAAPRSCHWMPRRTPRAFASGTTVALLRFERSSRHPRYVEPSTRGATPAGVAWRREGDSNPRRPCGLNGFQDRRNRPLCHLSGTESSGRIRCSSRCGRRRLDPTDTTGPSPDAPTG